MKSIITRKEYEEKYGSKSEISNSKKYFGNRSIVTRDEYDAVMNQIKTERNAELKKKHSASVNTQNKNSTNTERNPLLDVKTGAMERDISKLEDRLKSARKANKAKSKTEIIDSLLPGSSDFRKDSVKTNEKLANQSQ